MAHGGLLQFNLVVLVFLLYSISPDLFRHACTSRLVVHNEFYSQPVDLCLMVEGGAEKWPRTHRLLVYSPMSESRRMQDNTGHAYFGTRGCQQSSSLTNNTPFRSSCARFSQNRCEYAAQAVQRQASQGVQGVVGGTLFLQGVMSTLVLGMIIPHSTTTSTATATAVPDVSATGQGTCLCGFRSHQYSGNASSHGSIHHAVRRISE